MYIYGRKLFANLNRFFMNKYSICTLIILIGLIVSCKDKEKDKLYDEMKLAYENNIDLMNRNIDRAYTSLERKSERAETRELGLIWGTKAQKLKSTSDSIYLYIDSLKQRKDNGFTEMEIMSLYHILIDYKQACLAINLESEQYINSVLSITSNMKDSTEKTAKDFEAQYFPQGKNNQNIRFTYLTKLQNNIRKTEWILIDYFDKKCSYIDCGWYGDFCPIILQNTRCLKKGQLFEINAGIGYFSIAAKPTIKVNNKVVPLDFGGMALYQNIITNKAGKYKIPVEIIYTKPDGTKCSTKKEIEYTVDE